MVKLSQIKKVLFNLINRPAPRVVKHIALSLISFICLSFFILLFLPNQIINTYVKKNIERVIKEAYPSYSIHLGELHFSLWKNSLGCDSIKLMANDSTLTLKMASFSVSGVNMLKVLLQGNVNIDNFLNSVIYIQNIVLNYPHSYNELRLAQVQISVPDAEMIIDSINYYSLIDDEQFFAKDKFRQTRANFNVRQLTITGLNFPALISKNIYKAGTIKIFNPKADILVNMDKPYDQNSSNPLMPNEFLLSLKEIVKIDSLKIIKGYLEYKERYNLREKPGMISLNKVYISIKNISNQAGQDTAILKGEALFMNSGTMKLFMAIPLTSKDFSLRYSGLLSAMNITPINEFIERGEHRRIETGTLQSASFNINVKSGIASGTLRAVYKDLTVTVLNTTTGSEKGFVAKLSTLIGKIFITRGNNIPGEHGSMKIGNINYKRNRDDYFLQFVWFALRSGIGDLVGF